MVNNFYPSIAYRGERDMVQEYFDEYIRVKFYRTNDIIEFSPRVFN